MTHMLKAGEDRISTSIVEMDIIDLRIIAVIELRKYTTYCTTNFTNKCFNMIIYSTLLVFPSNYGKRTLLTNETLLIPIIYLKLFYSLLKVSLKGDNNASHEAVGRVN